MRLRTAGAAAGLLLVVLAVGLPPNLPGAWSSAARSPVFLGVAWAGFALGALLVLRLPARTAVPLILVGGLLLPAAAALSPPRSSDDVYRYGWDGRVQRPGSTRTGTRRPRPSWPACATPRSGRPGRTGACRPARPTRRPATRSPPAARSSTGRRCTPSTRRSPRARSSWPARSGAGPYRPYQWLAVLLALAITVLLLFGLRRLGHDPRRAVLWAWCPTVALEAGNNAHIDVLAALLTVGALLVLAGSRSRRGALGGGVLLGLAVATKLTPVLVAPAVLRRRPVAVLAALAGAVAVVYAAAPARGRGRRARVRARLPARGGVRRRATVRAAHDGAADRGGEPGRGGRAGRGRPRTSCGRPTRPGRGWARPPWSARRCCVAAPAYPWYALLLVALVGLGGGAWWLAVAAAGYVAQYGQTWGWRPRRRSGSATAWPPSSYSPSHCARAGGGQAHGRIRRRPAGRRLTTTYGRVRPDGCSRPADPSGPG